MDSFQQNHELNTIANEYTLMFPVCRVVAGSSILAISNDYYAKSFLKSKSGPHIYIETKDGQILQVSVDVSGWHLLHDSKHYETFESLMGSCCTSFTSSFGALLTEKLSKIAND